MTRLPGMTDTPETPEQSGGLSRKRFLQAGAVTAGSLYLGAAASGALAKTSNATTAPAPSGNPADMNMIIFMTDQERYIQHFPPAWSEKNLPGLTMLQKNGLTFTNATTNACMCSPARSTFFSGRFPAQTGVKYTLETDMYGANYPQVDLPFPSAAAAQSVGQTEANPLPNIAQVMADAGYYTVYKGKWHCSKYPPASAPADANTRNAMYPPQPTTEPVDMLLPFGWYRWNPEDAGADQSIPQMGAGLAANDDRYMASVGDYTEGTEGVLQFIKAWPTIRQSLPANQGPLPGSQQDFVINVGDRIYFDLDSYAIRADAQALLDSQATWLKRYGATAIRIEGNCDELGTREYNLALGARRANAVRDYLVGRGVNGERITTVSFGKEKPIDGGSGEEANAKNRNGHTVLVSGAR